MGEFQKENPNATLKEAAEFARNLVSELKETIQNNPSTKINDLFKAPTDNTKTNIVIPLSNKELQQNRDNQKAAKEQEQFRKEAERRGQVVM